MFVSLRVDHHGHHHAALVAQEDAVKIHRQHVDPAQIPRPERREQFVAAHLPRCGDRALARPGHLAHARAGSPVGHALQNLVENPLAAPDFLVTVENHLAFRAVVLHGAHPSFRDALLARTGLDCHWFRARAPVNPGIRAVNLTAQIRDLLRDDVQNPLPHHRADPVLENSLEILNPGLHRGLDALIFFHSVGWFQTFVQKQAVSEHRPVNQHYFILAL